MKTHSRLLIVAAVVLSTAILRLPAAESNVSIRAPYAQQVVKSLMAAHPDAVAIELHAKPPGSDTQVVVAGPAHIVGRKDTEFELRMAAKDVTSIATEMVAGNATVLVRVPLHDRDGKVMGLGVVAFKPAPGVDRLMLHVRALEIIGELSRRIPDAATLFQVNS